MQRMPPGRRYKRRLTRDDLHKEKEEMRFCISPTTINVLEYFSSMVGRPRAPRKRRAYAGYMVGLQRGRALRCGRDMTDGQGHGRK